jgi:hypothetical protein
MATTPEGKVKKKLDKELKLRDLWYFNPQAGPFGKAGVPDKLLCVKGHLIGIECKADKTKKPTALQVKCMEEIEAAGGKCFVVCDDETMAVALEYIDDRS